MNFITRPPRATRAAFAAVAEKANALAVVHRDTSPPHASRARPDEARLVLTNSMMTLLPDGCSYDCVNGIQRSKSAGIPSAALAGTTMSPVNTSVGGAE